MHCDMASDDSQQLHEGYMGVFQFQGCERHTESKPIQCFPWEHVLQTLLAMEMARKVSNTH